MLSFDADALIQALIQRLIVVMDSLMSEFYRDATNGLSAEGKEDVEVEKAKYNAMANLIETKCIFQVQAILESFGTGSKADTSAESYWAEYASSSNFNRARVGNRISGREAGSYTDVWGERRESQGRNAGRNLEGLHMIDTRTGEEHVVEPISPTRSIQNAEAWIIRDTETKVERRIAMEITKFLTEEGHRFFVEVGG